MKGSTSPPEGSLVLTRRAALGAGVALTLAGCNSMGVELPSVDLGKPATAPTPAGGSPVGEVLGKGQTRVGMILPLTQNGAPSTLGVSMRNAAQLAVDEFGSPYITLMIEDDRSTPEHRSQCTTEIDEVGRIEAVANHAAKAGNAQNSLGHGAARRKGKAKSIMRLTGRMGLTRRMRPISPIAIGNSASPLKIVGEC